MIRFQHVLFFLLRTLQLSVMSISESCMFRSRTPLISPLILDIVSWIWKIQSVNILLQFLTLTKHFNTFREKFSPVQSQYCFYFLVVFIIFASFLSALVIFVPWRARDLFLLPDIIPSPCRGSLKIKWSDFNMYSSSCSEPCNYQ